MQYNVIPTPAFQKDFKYYKKKYKSFHGYMKDIVEELERGNLVGIEVDGLALPENESAYKVRLANPDANKGTSGGFRLLYYVVKDNGDIYLLTVYSKSDREDIPRKEIAELIRRYCA
ncbi:hypothetical protein ACOALA_13365 [Alicyclobacillus acidoterrestris]|uniref:hypothetical protein n=1 Tax=Alicyclobacillus acidoterrestris TaxID=1450 RepID=UPI003F53161F